MCVIILQYILYKNVEVGWTSYILLIVTITTRYTKIVYQLLQAIHTIKVAW